MKRKIENDQLKKNVLKLKKKAFYFISKTFFVLKISKFASWVFGHVEKTTWLEG